MKYSLIIGYQLFEKNRDFPNIRVTLNDKFIEQFPCDNEESTELSLYEEKFVEIKGECGYGFKQLRLFKTQYTSPKKFTVIELDATNWPDLGKLTVEVENNDSNYNNGFVSKRSIVSLNPIFLIRTDLLNDKNTMQIIMQYEVVAKEHPPLMRRRGHDRVNRWRWPGRTAYPLCMDSNGIFWRTLDHEHTTKGGNFKLDFEVIKKHKSYILQQSNVVIDPEHKDSKHLNVVNGIFRMDDFFRAWYQSFTKDQFISRYSASYNRDHESIRHLEVAPAHLRTLNSEVRGDEHLVIRNFTNK